MAMCLCTDYRVILLMFAGNFGRQEVRAVERRVLLETLASKLPPGTISFSSKLKSIAEQGPDGTLLELEDGRQILSKVGEKGPFSKFCVFILVVLSKSRNGKCCLDSEGTLLMCTAAGLFFLPF